MIRTSIAPLHIYLQYREYVDCSTCTVTAGTVIVEYTVKIRKHFPSNLNNSIDFNQILRLETTFSLDILMIHYICDDSTEVIFNRILRQASL